MVRYTGRTVFIGGKLPYRIFFALHPCQIHIGILIRVLYKSRQTNRQGPTHIIKVDPLVSTSVTAWKMLEEIPAADALTS